MLQSCPSLCYSTVATPRFPHPTVAVVSGTRVFHATGLLYPPPIPLRLLHSFSPAAQTSPSPPTPLVPHHSSSSSSSISVLVVCSTARSFAISLGRLAQVPGPAFLSPGNCSNFDPRDPEWGCGHISVSHARIGEPADWSEIDIGPYWDI